MRRSAVPSVTTLGFIEAAQSFDYTFPVVFNIISISTTIALHTDTADIPNDFFVTYQLWEKQILPFLDALEDSLLVLR